VTSYFFSTPTRRSPLALQAEIQAAVRSGERAVWKIEWSVVAYGKELKYFLSQSSLERLFRRDMIERFEGAVHEHAVLTSPRRRGT
jgi:hypothetical protein